MTRWAVYWVPPESHPLWRAGCEWLGRDPALPEAGVPPSGRAAPWRYGFHATLKAPLRLRGGASEAQWVAAAQALAAEVDDFEMPALDVGWLAGFLALVPAAPLAHDHPLHRLAERCVRELDGWRVTPTPQELAQRIAERTLDEEQRRLAMRWGYPHVMQRWRFHMTLSDTLPAADIAGRAALEDAARQHFAAALREPLRAEALSLFVEPAAPAPLRLAYRLPLGLK